VFDITPAGARLAAAGEMLLRSRETITWANVTETGTQCSLIFVLIYLNL
jgi:hypothetical protein